MATKEFIDSLVTKSSPKAEKPKVEPVSLPKPKVVRKK